MGIILYWLTWLSMTSCRPGAETKCGEGVGRTGEESCLQNSSAAYSEHFAQAVEEGVHVLLADCLYHLTAHNLVKAALTLHMLDFLRMVTGRCDHGHWCTVAKRAESTHGWWPSLNMSRQPCMQSKLSCDISRITGCNAHIHLECVCKCRPISASFLLSLATAYLVPSCATMRQIRCWTCTLPVMLKVPYSQFAHRSVGTRLASLR